MNVSSRGSNFIYFLPVVVRSQLARFSAGEGQNIKKKQKRNLHKPLVSNCALRVGAGGVSKVKGWEQVCLQGLERKSFPEEEKKTQQELNTEFWHLRQQTPLLPPAPILSLNTWKLFSKDSAGHNTSPGAVLALT